MGPSLSWPYLQDKAPPRGITKAGVPPQTRGHASAAAGPGSPEFSRRRVSAGEQRGVPLAPGWRPGLKGTDWGADVAGVCPQAPHDSCLPGCFSPSWCLGRVRRDQFTGWGPGSLTASAKFQASSHTNAPPRLKPDLARSPECCRP